MSFNERKITPKLKSTDNKIETSNSNLSGLKSLYERNTPFWKKKCFLFYMVLISCIGIGLLTFFAFRDIYNQGENSSLFLYNISRHKTENSVKPLENYSSTSSPLFQKQIRRFLTEFDEIREQEISVSCELNNGIKELNYEIKRLYDSLTRLDARVNREKRGVNEQTEIGDCAQMKGKFKKIYDDLNRISEALSVIDENGICRCKCPLNKTASTTTEVTSDQPLELTTFTYENVNEQPSSSEKTKQFKTIKLYDYKPQQVIDNLNIKFKSVVGDETTVGTTTYEEKKTSTTPVIEENISHEKSITTTETIEDIPSTRSNSVTGFNNSYTQTVEPQTTSYNEVVTKNYEKSQMTTSETTESSLKTENETSEMTELNYDEITTALETSSTNGEVPLELTTEVNSESTTKISVPSENVINVNSKKGNTNFKKGMYTLTFTDEYVSESTTKTQFSGKNENNVFSKGRTSDEDENYYIKKENDTTTNKPKTYEENKTLSKLSKHDDKTTTRPEITHQVAQQKWIPMCFYPVPCLPNVLNNNQQSTQDTNTNTIQYSAQSLNTYKKKAPLTDATIIQNNYPIMSYCPMGMVCPTTDFAGQANTLHCMLKPTFFETSLIINKNDANATNKLIKDNYNNSVAEKPAVMKAKSARDSDEILTGNLDCPLNTFPCLDNSGCIDTENWCDGRIHCDDASDESQCNCKERIDKDKLCDGYYDCPSGEDELGCFGCNNETFSCGDWDNVLHRSSCFERKNRCDRVKNCPNGRDEDECTLLSRHLENPNQIFFISYSTGYLHHNWKGNWYPMCGDSQMDVWAEKACTVESGDNSKPNRIQYINEPTNYDGPYISIDENNRITLLDSCEYHGILVECEPEICGMRSELKFNKNIDPDRMKRSSYLEYLNNNASRFTRSKDPRVVGGIPSNPGAWPWLIALYQDGIFHCGGVILSDSWVLTAAHCVSQYQTHFYEVQAGILRRFSFSPMEQSRTVTHVIVHTQYSRSTMVNDLAVLKLERSLEFNRWVRPVCLPDQKLSWIPFPGTICTAVGWGATVEHGPDPDNMREVEVPILPECTHKTDIEAREICAGYLAGGHDTCQGDSGGPLLCREPNNLNKWYVAGIVSHGEGCARPMEPGVYTRVALYMDWIIKVTDEKYLPEGHPQLHCPGIRCKTGKQCVPTKRQCDKYVDCMNAEDEQNCDYAGSQYQVDLYRSRNTDHSSLKYRRLKNAVERDNITTVTASNEQRTTVLQRVNTTPTTAKVVVTVNKSETVQVENSTIAHDVGVNDTVLSVLRSLFDNHFAEETFSCRRIAQIVLKDHHCDGTVDCEDGTDEEACDCRTRLASMFNSSAVCDGLMDCHDGADEKKCAPKCKSDERYCGQSSKVCIKRTAWCDGVVDCNDGSDENYCTAITNGTTAVILDVTGRPDLRQSGIVAVNRNGFWKVQCVDESTAPKIAHDTCSSLHFASYDYYKRQMAWNRRLPLNMKQLKITDACEGLFVECAARKTVDAARPHHWHVNIIVDGRLVQSGVLIKSSWVLVRRTNMNFKDAYVTAVLGGGSYNSIWIKSPYEQIIRVDGVREIPDTDLDLLHLASPATASRAVTPLGVPLFLPSITANDTCYAVGYNPNNNNTETAYLQPRANECVGDNVCFTVSRTPQSCSNGKNISHVTAVVCESNFGLFLAASAVQRSINFCDRNARLQLPRADDLMEQIVNITDEDVKTNPAPLCNGKRCQLGECVPWEKVCDGIPHCRDEQDETIKMCRARTIKCKTNETLCICEVGSFRCANGKCVPKNAFCDGINDCGDRTDEPETCQKNTCVDYLKLTDPQRLCDGRWDCLDKTDEEFTNCPGYCNRTDVYHCQSTNKCISSELVCDGEKDCPESDDESECMGLITPVNKKYIKNEGVLAIRSYGKWHPQCITEDYTNLDYHSLCKGLGFKYAVGIKKTASTTVDFENFSSVQLNNSTDVTIRSATKNIVRYTNHACTATYLVCSST